MEGTVTIDSFCSWLCERENSLVGYSSSYYHSPLALWLSEVFRYTCGIEDCFYGRASFPQETWRLLPIWAQRFVNRLERHSHCLLYGCDVLTVLAQVELSLSAVVVR